MRHGMVAVDTNILVYAHLESSEWHRAALAAMDELANTGLAWAIPWPCVHEFLAVVTNPRLFQRPGALASALQEVENWRACPELRLLGELPGHWNELKPMLAAGQLRGGAIHDARIAALCLEHGVGELWTADRDFSRIAGLKTRNPLLS